MSSHVTTLIRQAKRTFSTTDLFSQNLELLKAILNKTTVEDVNLPPCFMSQELWETPNKAPVTYVDIYENSNLTVGIFILKPNMKLPLHNHPQMHGLIKVILGKVKITSYSLNTDKTREIDKNPVTSTQFVTAEKCVENVVGPQNECCLLEPDLRNLHEIESVEGPAAFIDILGPPYETPILGTHLVRKCSYYRVLREVLPGVFRLQEITSPSWYWTDTFPYTGPELT